MFHGLDFHEKKLNLYNLEIFTTIPKIGDHLQTFLEKTYLSIFMKIEMKYLGNETLVISLI